MRRTLAGIVGTVAALAVLAPGVASGGGINHVIGSEDLGSEGGVSYRSATYNDVPMGSISYAVAQCPDGERAIGGGGSDAGAASDSWITDTDMEYLNNEEVPPTFKQAWTTGVKNDAGAPIDFTGYAICRDSAGLRFVKHSKSETMEGKPFKTKVMCPSGTRVVSGGYDSGGNQDRTWASTPIDGKDSDTKPDDGWMARILASQDLRTLRVRAICAEHLGLSYEGASHTDSGAIKAEGLCPPDATVAGGGAKLNGPADDLGSLHGMTPVDFGDLDSVPGDGWFADAYAPAGATITTTAICLG